MGLNYVLSLDILGAALALAATVLYVKESVKAWPIGLLASVINILLYYERGIYANCGLEWIFLFLSLYGWYLWSRADKSGDLPIRRLSAKEIIVLSLASGTAIAVLWYALAHWAQAAVPWWDAITGIMGLVAEWLICRKVIEAWLIWGFVNTLLVGLYFYKGIPVHASEELVYIALSVIGYSQWLRRLSGSVESSGASKAYGDQV